MRITSTSSYKLRSTGNPPAFGPQALRATSRCANLRPSRGSFDQRGNCGQSKNINFNKTLPGRKGVTLHWPHLDEHIFAAYFTDKDLGPLLFPAAGAVVQADAPAVPAADDFALLDNAFTQWEAQMGAEVLDGMNT